MPAWMTRRPTWAAAALVALGIGTAAGLLTARPQARPSVARVARAAASVPAPASSPAASPGQDAWWTPLRPATSAFVPAQLVIQSLRVKAPVEVKGVSASNVMEAPDTGAGTYAAGSGYDHRLVVRAVRVR